MELGLTGRRALVTGASSGIGFACALALAAEGCDVALAGRDVHRLKAAVKAVRAHYRVGVTSHATDLASPIRQAALVEVVGDIDILVNSAGQATPGDLSAISDPTWRAAWELEVFGYINLARLVLPRLQARGWGVVVNLIGTTDSGGDAQQIVDTTGNAALAGFTRAMGAASLRHGVRVVGVSPGPVMTERLESNLRWAARQRWGNEHRWDELIPTDPPPARPEQVADVVTFLVSDRASHISGTVVTVDGGASAG